MKKSISILTTAILCAGMCSSPVYANAADERPTYIYNTPEELLDIVVSEDEELTDGEIFYPKNYKIDALDRGERCDIIIYGLKSTDEIREIETKSRENGCVWAGIPERYSGVTRQGGSTNFRIEPGDYLNVYYFIADTPNYDGYGNKTLLDAAILFSFDVAPYVYSKLTPGDADCDGAISPTDASMILSAYAMLSTAKDGRKPIFNSTIFDYDNDGVITPSDASATLTKYAELSTL